MQTQPDSLGAGNDGSFFCFFSFLAACFGSVQVLLNAKCHYRRRILCKNANSSRRGPPSVSGGGGFVSHIETNLIQAPPAFMM